MLFVALASFGTMRDGHLSATADELLTYATLVAAMAADVELGRRAENGRLVGQRPHKGLSAWGFAAVLLISHSWAISIVVPVYAYARWRGMRVQLDKWIGSAAILGVSAWAAQAVLRAFDAPLTTDRGALAVAVAALAFLGAEAGGFLLVAYAGDPVDEQWLRAQLRSTGFYGNELAVLAQGSVLALLWSADHWFAVFLLPSYAVLQRALLHAPLREEADHDAKTGLLTMSAWQRSAQRDLMLGRPGIVMLADLDNFKRVNDSHGHLVGDQVLRAAAQELGGALRPVDVLGRFGGEEFCIFLPETDAAQGAAAAERLRQAVEAMTLPSQPDVRLTVSIGVCSADRIEPDGLTRILGIADEQLYAAKGAGRNCVRCTRVSGAAAPVDVTVPQRRRADDPVPRRRSRA